MPEIVYDKLQTYLTTLVPPREPVLVEMEEYAEKNNFPALGPVCGYHDHGGRLGRPCIRRGGRPPVSVQWLERRGRGGRGRFVN